MTKVNDLVIQTGIAGAGPGKHKNNLYHNIR